MIVLFSADLTIRAFFFHYIFFSLEIVSIAILSLSIYAC